MTKINSSQHTFSPSKERLSEDIGLGKPEKNKTSFYSQSSFSIYEKSLPFNGEQRDFIIRRAIRERSNRNRGRYGVSKTCVILKPKNKNGENQVLATIFESARFEGVRYVRVLSYENFRLKDAEKMANHLGLLPKG